MRNKIIAWIKDQVRQSGAKGIVMGLSGGIDSSVVAALAKEAIGRKRLFGLFLPCHSHGQDLVDARIIARQLKIKTKLIDLSSVYDGLLKLLPAAGSLAKANLKPRLRMIVLYYFANKLNYLVCGTGNKSELMAGYFTKHGDGATDLLPIGGLLKKDVRRLAAELNIPKRIIDKAPSAGLWIGQTDEGEMGISYTDLDNILTSIERGRSLKDSGKVRRVRKMIEKSGHKRQGPKVFYLKKGG